ncbi:MAG: hypothetical protein AB7O52_01710 [Planctomycetota bacterium]
MFASIGMNAPARVVHSWLATALLTVCLSAGCNSGGGGGGTSAVQNNNSSVHSVSVVPGVTGTRVQFVLSSPDADRMEIRLEFSENRGRTFEVATLDPDQVVTNLDSSPAGIPYEVVWDPRLDLESLAQGDLQVRLLPRNLTLGQDGTAAYSAVFGLGANTPPTIHTVTTPIGTHGGAIEIGYTVSDADGDTIGIELEYSLDAGANWISGTVAPGGDGAEAVPTTVAPAARTIFWFAQADAPNHLSGQARVRLVPVDIGSGTGSATGIFGVNLIAPAIDALTISEIPAEMNGSQSYTDVGGTVVDFHVRVPTIGAEIELRYRAGTGGGAPDPTTLEVTASRAFGSVPAGSDLGDQFDRGATSASWQVPATHTIAPGFVTLAATIRDSYGNVSNTRELEIEAVTATALERPFDVHERWWLNFGSDLFTTTFTGGATVTVTTSATPDGTSDFFQDLSILGITALDPTPECIALGSNQILEELAREQVVGRLRELYGGDFDGTLSLYSPNLSFSLVATGARSSIRVGGDDSSAGYTLGRAYFDHRNAVGNTNQSTTLGVFTTNMIQYYINTSSTFQNRFNALVPGRGTPAGQHALDAVVLAPAFERLALTNTTEENARYDQIWTAIDAFGRATATIIAHEVGHSMGLCSNGALPGGLFGGVIGPSWSGGFTNDYHFDSPGPNLMAAALSFTNSIATGVNGYRFNEVNQAYLRETILLGN